VVIPQAWISAALIAAGAHFGPLDVSPARVVVRELPKRQLATYLPPRTIVLDRRRWQREPAQCSMVFIYGLLTGHKPSKRRSSIMHPVYDPRFCHVWLERNLGRHRP
jgi:hypothetical protein